MEQKLRQNLRRVAFPRALEEIDGLLMRTAA
jgi:hypothetical protein